MTGLATFDVRPADLRPAGWYRFKTPPGVKSLIVTARGEPRCWISSTEIATRDAPAGPVGRFQFDVPAVVSGEAVAVLKIEQERGHYGGAALPEPIAFRCEHGTISVGDWSKIEGLESYSGGMWYRKKVTLTRTQARGRVTLDLGKVAASAEVLVNGKAAWIRSAPSWRWDLTGLVKPGNNRLEILAYNTLANHYLTIPTRYRGQPTSGILGPVQLRVTSIVPQHDGRAGLEMERVGSVETRPCPPLAVRAVPC